MWGKRRPNGNGEPQTLPSEPEPSKYAVVDIRVPDDGHSLIGRRFIGYITEVRRRQEAQIPQDHVTVWHRRPSVAYTWGTPRVNDKGELEILGRNEELLGRVRELDRRLYFFLPEE